jgi:hypothetical protein
MSTDEEEAFREKLEDRAAESSSCSRATIDIDAKIPREDLVKTHIAAKSPGRNKIFKSLSLIMNEREDNIFRHYGDDE